METPLCTVCLNSDILCAGCSRRLASGEITETTVRTARALNALAEKAPSLREASLKTVLETPTHLLLIVSRGSAGKLVGKGGVVAKGLREALGKSIRVIEETTDARLFLQNILFPIPVLGVGVRYANGSETLSVRVQRRRLPLSAEAVASIALQVLKKPVELTVQ